VAANPPDIAYWTWYCRTGILLKRLFPIQKRKSSRILISNKPWNEQAAVAAMQSGSAGLHRLNQRIFFANMPGILTRAMNQWSLIQKTIQAEQALLTSEENFHNSIDNSPPASALSVKTAKHYMRTKRSWIFTVTAALKNLRPRLSKTDILQKVMLIFTIGGKKRRSREPLPDNYESKHRTQRRYGPPSAGCT